MEASAATVATAVLMASGWDRLRRALAAAVSATGSGSATGTARTLAMYDVPAVVDNESSSDIEALSANIGAGNTDVLLGSHSATAAEAAAKSC
jgi:hypothetical protein